MIGEIRTTLFYNGALHYSLQFIHACKKLICYRNEHRSTNSVFFEFIQTYRPQEKRKYDWR